MDLQHPFWLMYTICRDIRTPCNLCEFGLLHASTSVMDGALVEWLLPSYAGGGKILYGSGGVIELNKLA